MSSDTNIPSVITVFLAIIYNHVNGSFHADLLFFWLEIDSFGCSLLLLGRV
jgi:hypothetical protein